MSGTVYNKLYNDFLSNNINNNNINNTKEPWKNASDTFTYTFKDGTQKTYTFDDIMRRSNDFYAGGSGSADRVTMTGLEFFANSNNSTYSSEAQGALAFWNNPDAVMTNYDLYNKVRGIANDKNSPTVVSDEKKTEDETGDETEDETGDGSPTLSYEDFLKQNGFDIEGDKERAILRAAQEYDRSRATYGMKAEQLAQSGLTNSGYSDYTDAMAYAAYIGNLSQAEQDAIYKELQASAQYQNYLKQKRAEDQAIAQQNFKNDQAVKATERANAQQDFENMVTLLTSGLAPEVASTLMAALGYNEEEVAEFMKNYNQIYNQTVTPETTPEVTPETTPEVTPEVTPEEEVYPMYAQLIGEGHSDSDAKMILAANGYDDDAVTSASQTYYTNNGAGGKIATDNVISTVKNADLSGNAVDAISTLTTQSLVVDMQTGVSDADKSEAKGAVSAALKDLFIKSIDDVDTLLTYAASAIADEFGGKKDETGVKGWSKAKDGTKTQFLLGLVDEAYKTNALTDADYKAFYEDLVSKGLEDATNLVDFSELAIKAYDNKLCPSNKKLSNEVGEKTINLLKEFIVSVKVEAEEHKPGSGRQEYTPSPKVVIKFKNGKESRAPVGYSTKKGYYVFYNLTSEQNDALNSILIQLKSQNK